jgi:hypothetical protein
LNDKVNDRGGKIPTSDGKAKNFAMRWNKFLANAAMSGFKDRSKENQDKNLPEREVSDDDAQNELTNEQQTAVKENEIAIACF